MLLKVSIALFLFIAFQSVLGTDPNELRETAQEKQLNQQKRRLSLQNTAEIQHCLVNAGDVGCGMFECFNNNSCEIRGLNEICMTFLHNAGKFDSQGKSFIKDALRCMAHGVRGRFSCVSRRCVAVEDMVFQLQRDCYLRHNLCLAARDNVHVMVDMVHFHHLFPKGPHVELVNILLGCGDAVRAAIARRVQAQCEQNWGALCQSLSLCSLGQSDQPLSQSDQPLGQSDQPLSQSDQPLSQSDQPLSQSNQPLSDYTQRPVTALPSTLQGRNTLLPGVQLRLSLPEPDPHGPDQDQDQGGQPWTVQAQPKPQGLSQNQNQDQGQDHATDLVLSGPNSATQG